MIRLAVPTIVENLLQSSVYLVDALMLAQVGQIELAAVSLTGMFLWRLTEVVACIQKGSSAFVARRWGEGRFQAARSAATHSMTLAGVLGLATVSVVLFLLPWIYTRLGGAPDVVGVAVHYTVAVLAVFPFTQMFINLSSSMRAAGDTRTPAIATIIVNIVNVACNYALIFGKLGFPALGMVGAGIATGFSLFVGWAFLTVIAVRGVRPRNLFASPPPPDLDDTEKGFEAGGVPAVAFPHLPRKPAPSPESFHLSVKGLRLWLADTTPVIFRVSRATFLEEIFVSAGFLAFFRMIAESGTAAMAAHSAVVRIESLSYMMGAGFAVASATLVGQSLGRRDPRTAGRAMWLGCLAAMSIMGVIGIGYALIPATVLSVFSPDADFLAIAVPLLIIAAIEQPMLGAALTLSGSLRGAGDTVSPTVSQFFGTLCVRVGAGYYLAFPCGLGIQGIYWATVIDWTVRVAILTALIARGRWRTIRV